MTGTAALRRRKRPAKKEKKMSAAEVAAAEDAESDTTETTRSSSENEGEASDTSRGRTRQNEERENLTPRARVWPPEVDEAPNWPDGLRDDQHSDIRPMWRRLLHWGPIIAILIILYVGSVTVMFITEWWPIDTVGGALHLAIFLFWNYATLHNMTMASFVGPGYVPKGWMPPQNSQRARLQLCDPCTGYKAPRAHHCSRCGRCSMKMDHHCPWINNCVGHKNHALFVRFLASGIFGCLHAIVVHGFCFYHIVNIGYYIRYGDGTEPIIEITFWSFLALIAASAFAFGVVIGLSGLLFIQLRYIKNNKTGIEAFIDEKATSYRENASEWVYPYDLGWRRNVREVLCSWSAQTAGNGIWWPVVRGCHQFTLTEEQLALKRMKRQMSRLVKVVKDFKGGYFKSLTSIGFKAFICQPISDETRVAVNVDELWVVTRRQKHWYYGHYIGDNKRKGWLPVVCAELMEERPHQIRAQQGAGDAQAGPQEAAAAQEVQ